MKKAAILLEKVHCVTSIPIVKGGSKLQEDEAVTIN